MCVRDRIAVPFPTTIVIQSLAWGLQCFTPIGKPNTRPFPTLPNEVHWAAAHRYPAKLTQEKDKQVMGVISYR